MITFSNNEYRKSHGKNPTGRGGWAFIVSKTARDLLAAAPAGELPISFFDNGSEHVVFLTGPSRTLGESKKLFRSILTRCAPKGANLYVEVAP